MEASLEEFAVKYTIFHLSFRSREEIEVWKEKQRQVKKEEENVRASENIESKDESKTTTGYEPVVENNNWMVGKQEIHQIERKEIWIYQAAVFIRQVCMENLMK